MIQAQIKKLLLWLLPRLKRIYRAHGIVILAVNGGSPDPSSEGVQTISGASPLGGQPSSPDGGKAPAPLRDRVVTTDAPGGHASHHRPAAKSMVPGAHVWAIAVLLCALVPTVAHSQGGGGSQSTGPHTSPAAPTSGCGNQELHVNNSNGDFYDCKAGAYFKVNGGGAGTGCLPPGTTDNLLYDDGVGGCADLGSLGSTNTLLHGNAAGLPTFGSVVSADLNITTTTCTNQVVSAISSSAAGTCHTIVSTDTSGTFPPGGTATGDLSGSYPGPAVAAIHGTTVPTNAASDQFLRTTGSAVAGWATMPDCQDSAGNHVNYTASTHALSCGTTGSGGGVSSFSGDGNLLNNSSSTGAVTATIANAGAHKWWGNNTGSTAAPGYQSIGSADLPATAVQTNQANTYSTGAQDFTGATSALVTTQPASDSSTKAASTQYVTTAVANAIAAVNPAVAVQAATTAASDTSGFTYNNGAAGIGAFFSGSVNTAVTVDGFTFTAVGQRLLVKNDTQSPSGAFNGIYNVTQIQTAILAPILTRALDYDQPSDINNTGAIPVVNGTANAQTTWVETAAVTTVGTSPLTFVEFSLKPSTIITTSTSAGGDLTGTYPNPGVAKINGTAFAGSNGDVVSFGASNIPADSGILATNVVRKDAANTGATGMTLDMSAATGATALKVPVIAGATAGADGVIDYDSTAKLTKVRTNGADSSVVAETATSTTTTQVLHATAVAGIGTFSAVATGDLPGSGATTPNGQTCTLGSTCNVNVGATAHSVALNQGNGSAITGVGPGTTGQILSATTSADPTYINFPDVKVIPAANCNNTTAGPGWSLPSGGTVSCRAGTNNLGGSIVITDTTSTFPQFGIAIPEDDDVTVAALIPYIRFQIGSTNAVNARTIIPQVKVACEKGDGTTTDDVAFNAAHSLSTITENATTNQFWSTSNVQMNSTDMTGCAAGSWMIVQVGRATDTDVATVRFYGASITFPRRLVVQAD